MLDVWFLPPVAALVFGLLALAPLGEQVLRRGVVFIDLAVAQAAAATALWAGTMSEHPDPWLTQALAAGGALACAALVAWLSRRWPSQREALIGLLYVLGASMALLGARHDAHGHERLAELLAADVLWAGWLQVAILAACALAVHATRRWLGGDRMFFPVFALAASAAVPVLGLFVVFALLIAPALWRQAGCGWPLALSAAGAACALGLAGSWLLDAPSGACVALMLSACGTLSVASSGRAHGRR
ncbi:metal ABC transporter permease [Piscinibacter sp.]|uniref:metal ABC transporter permease n=1 Tax=Piscinibacter sp. TaxID=1903157 RepID=UPI0039E2483D